MQLSSNVRFMLRGIKSTHLVTLLLTFDFMLITETHLHIHAPNNAITIPDYTPPRKLAYIVLIEKGSSRKLLPLWYNSPVTFGREQFTHPRDLAKFSFQLLAFEPL